MVVASPTLQQQRNRLVAKIAVTFFLIVVASGFGVIRTWTAWIAPKPDTAKLFMIELARQHYTATGTTTIVKETDLARSAFEQQYRFRNRLYGLPEDPLPPARDDEVLSFSYAPGGNGFVALTLSDIKQAPTPLALFRRRRDGQWLYGCFRGVNICYSAPSTRYRKKQI